MAATGMVWAATSVVARDVTDRPAPQAVPDAARRLRELANHASEGVRTSAVRNGGQNAVMSLWAQFLDNRGRLIHKWAHYFPVYERHFARYVNRPCVFWEIGVSGGGSLQLWKRYLGPHAQIVGIDLDPAAAFAEDQIAVRIGDQSDTGFLQQVLDELGTPDVVLDDGSHQMHDLATTFRYLYPRLAADGVYFVEDLHTAYWEEYGGGLGHPDSFVELAKRCIDELNADHARGALEPSAFTAATLSIHFYDSISVFERGRHLPKHAPRTGTPSGSAAAG